MLGRRNKCVRDKCISPSVVSAVTVLNQWSLRGRFSDKSGHFKADLRLFQAILRLERGFGWIFVSSVRRKKDRETSWQS